MELCTSATDDDEAGQGDSKKPPLFRISLAQWSLHNTLFSGKLDNRDFAKVAKNDFQIEAIEYVNQFFKDKAEDSAYLAELKARQEEHNVRALLIMIDGEGALGDSDATKRQAAVRETLQVGHCRQDAGLPQHPRQCANFGERSHRSHETGRRRFAKTERIRR